MRSLAADARSAFSIARKAGWLLLLPIGMDALFFIVYGFVRYGFFDYLAGHLASLAAGFLQAFSLEGSGRVLLIILLASISLFIVYCIFQSLSWWLCHMLSGSRISYSSFLARFSRLSAAWATLYFVYSAASLYFYVRSANLQSAGSFYYILLAFLLLIFYFSAASYSSRDLSFRSAFKNSLQTRTISTMLAIATVFLLLSAISYVSTVLSTVIQLLVVLPLFTYARLILISSGKNI
ncbi:MAG: hypothetical protein ABIF10_07890 [Candidatus Woesearchaeota archaeon]